MMRMITRLSHVTILVRDQDEALKWYTEKLGMEKRMDAPMGDERWLTVGIPGQRDLEIVLAKPCPGMGRDSTDVLMGRIGQGPAWVLDTPDCRRTYDELTARGVAFTKPPDEADWGVYATFEDLYGNEFVLVEPHTVTPNLSVAEQEICACEG